MTRTSTVGEGAARVAAYAALLGGVGLALAALASGHRIEAILAVVFTAAGAVFVRSPAVPILAAAGFTLTSLVPCAGWTFGLFQSVGPYDELAHLGTGFGVTPVLLFLLLPPSMPARSWHPLRLAVLTVSVGLAAAAVWEIAEWAIIWLTSTRALSGSYNDTITDMILGGFGAAGSFATVLVARGGRVAGASHGAALGEERARARANQLVARAAPVDPGLR